MDKRKDILRFAEKYQKLYADLKTDERELDIRFAKECIALGFEMDCGKEFIDKFSQEAFDQSEELVKIISQVDNYKLLGSAILSKWRFITHWTRSSLLEEDNRRWFVTAFGRMSALVRNEKDECPEIKEAIWHENHILRRYKG